MAINFETVTGNQTSANVLTQINNNFAKINSGLGLNADTVDNKHASELIPGAATFLDSIISLDSLSVGRYFCTQTRQGWEPVAETGSRTFLIEVSLNTPNNASLTDILDKRIYFSDKKGIAKQYAVDPEYKLALTIDHLADAVGLDKEGLEIIASHLEMPIEDVKKIVEDYKIGLDFVRRKTNEEDFIYPAYLNIRKHADVDLDGDIIARLSKE